MKNVFAGISLSNKKLNSQIVGRINEVAFQGLQADRLCYLVADELEHINLRVFRGGNEQSIRERAAKSAARAAKIITDNIESRYKSKISISYWSKHLDATYWKDYSELFRLYCVSDSFREEIVDIARAYAAKRSSSPNEDQLVYLGTYALHELPTILSGIRIGSKKYRTLIYPSYTNGSLLNIAKRIDEGAYGAVELGAPGCQVIEFDLDQLVVS